MDKIKDSGSFDASSILAGTSKKGYNCQKWLVIYTVSNSYSIRYSNFDENVFIKVIFLWQKLVEKDVLIADF